MISDSLYDLTNCIISHDITPMVPIAVSVTMVPIPWSPAVIGSSVPVARSMDVIRSIVDRHTNVTGRGIAVTGRGVTVTRISITITVAVAGRRISVTGRYVPCVYASGHSEPEHNERSGANQRRNLPHIVT